MLTTTTASSEGRLFWTDAFDFDMLKMGEETSRMHYFMGTDKRLDYKYENGFTRTSYDHLERALAYYDKHILNNLWIDYGYQLVFRHLIESVVTDINVDERSNGSKFLTYTATISFKNGYIIKLIAKTKGEYDKIDLQLVYFGNNVDSEINTLDVSKFQNMKLLSAGKTVSIQDGYEGLPPYVKMILQRESDFALAWIEHIKTVATLPTYEAEEVC